jgi:uncharacterized protein YqgC (DUF456 family)
MAVMVTGLFSLMIPVVPGLFIIWAAALVYGVVTGFTTGGWIAFAVISLLWLIGSLADNVLMGAKALKTGASWWTLGIASAAGIAGSLLVPPVGGLIAALAAAYLFELWRHRDSAKALEMTKQMVAGCGLAFFIRFGIGRVMIGVWMIWAFRG